MAREKAPAFQFYPKDFLADVHVAAMSCAARGVYITLLAHCWLEQSLPFEAQDLAALCSLPLSTFLRIWPTVEPCFHLDDDARLHHKRLDLERAKQRHNREQGRNAALARWQDRWAQTGTK